MGSAPHRLRALAAVLFVSAGCSLFLDWNEPPRTCAQGEACPDGQACVEGRCEAPSNPDGGNPATDSGVAEEGDGGPPDAGRPLRDAGTVAVGDLAVPRARPEATRLASGQVFITGGFSTTWHKTSEVFTPETNSWSVGPSMFQPRADFALVQLPAGDILVMGGSGEDGGYLNESNLVAANLLSVQTTQSMAGHRFAPTATALLDGGVLVAGGYPAWNTSERYGPPGVFFDAGTMNAARHRHAAVRLTNGQVLVTGGNGGGATHASVELYNPATQSWSAQASMGVARHDHTCTLLSDGTVLVAGGRNSLDGGLFRSAERYDPQSNAWSPAADMALARWGHTATLLEDGKVLVTGGVDPSGTNVGVELYDPASNSWTTLPPLLSGRAEHVAVLLQDGTVLIAGGAGVACERYTPP